MRDAETFWVTPDVVAAVDAEVLAHPPERGGALLGPPGIPAVTRFVFDPHARVTEASYTPSRWLNEQVRALERRDRLELRGILHSHPDGLDRPSGPDIHEFTTGLRLNAHMARYLGPIATRRPAGPPAPHELATRHGKISWYAAYRADAPLAEVRPLAVSLVEPRRLARLQQSVPPFSEALKETVMIDDVRAVAAAFEAAQEPVFFETEVEGVRVSAGRLALDGEVELLVLAGAQYPHIPPTALVTCGGQTEQLPLRWDLAQPAEERLLTALKRHFAGPGPYRKVHGPHPERPLTDEARRAAAAGWRPFFSGRDPAGQRAALASGLRARGSGLLSEELARRTVLVVGLGSVGGYLADALARQGIGRLIGVDPDAVEPENLSRTLYDVADIGRPKAEVLARHLLNANPSLAYEPLVGTVQALGNRTLEGLIRRSDLVVAASDDPAAQRIVNRHAYARGVPAVFVGLYAGAKGGEVILSVPERGACYECATAARHSLERAGDAVAPSKDYGTGRLAGEVALAADIQHVASAAVKAGLSLLLTDGGAATLKGFLDPLLESGETYLTFGMEPGYWFYPSLFEPVPGQFAYQSVCLAPERRADCPACGEPAAREEPAEMVLQGPGLAALQAALAGSAGDTEG